MECDFCGTDFKNELLSRTKVDEGEVVFLCKNCKEQLIKLNYEARC